MNFVPVPVSHRGALQSLIDVESPGDAIIWDPQTDPAVPDEIRGMFVGIAELASNTISRVRDGLGVSEKIYVALIGSLEFQAAAVEIAEHEFCVLLWLGAYVKSRAAPKHIVGAKALVAIIGGDVSGHKFNGQGSATQIFAEQMSMQPNVDLSSANERTAALICSGVLEWLILHELGHIINGHLRLGRQMAGLRYIIEKTSEESLEDAMVTSQTLEMDADSFATQNLLVFSRMFAEAPAKIAKEAGLADGAAHAAFAQICTDIVGKFLEYPIADKAKIFEVDHPWGQLRTWCNGLVLLEVLKTKPWFISEDDAIKAIMLSTYVVDKSILEVSGIGPDPIVRETIEIAGPYIDRTLARWAKIRPELVPHKLGKGNLAPASVDPA